MRESPHEKLLSPLDLARELEPLARLTATERLLALQVDQRRRWLQGDRLPVELYRAALPILQTEPRCWLDLACNELLIRQCLGEAPTLEEYYLRFPEHRDDLARHFRTQEALDTTLTLPSNAADTNWPSTIGPSEDADLSFLDPPLAADEVGRLGGYLLRRLIGQGGMGLVFLAEDTDLRRTVALKVMKPACARVARARLRFLREAQAMAAVKSSHVVNVYQVGQVGQFPFLAMELLAGESLERRLQRQERLPWPDVVRVGRETAAGLAAAHQCGLIHRDIKPSNLWLEDLGSRGPAEPAERTKILDFGLARVVESDERLTRLGEVIGTPAYMAPEQARGEVVDARADLFSLGCVLYQLSTGQRPFVGNGVLATLQQLAVHQPPPLASLCPEIPAFLSALVEQLLAKDPAQRPPSAQAVIATLDTGTGDTRKLPTARVAIPAAEVLTQEMPATPASVPASAAIQSPAPTRRFVRVAVVAATLAVLGLLAAAGYSLRGWVLQGRAPLRHTPDLAGASRPQPPVVVNPDTTADNDKPFIPQLPGQNAGSQKHTDLPVPPPPDLSEPPFPPPPPPPGPWPGDPGPEKCPSMGGNFYSRYPVFRIPFLVSETDQARTQEVVLAVSGDYGKTYQKVATAPPTQRFFRVQLPAEGWYWFAVQVKERTGRTSPANLNEATPQVKVCIDSTPPVVSLKQLPSSEGTFGIEWDVRDDNPDPETLHLEYRPVGRPEWLPLSLQPGYLQGVYRWAPEAKGVRCEVRLRLQDRARNAGEQTILVEPGVGVSAETTCWARSKTIGLPYEVQNIGKSGVKCVEVWMTRDTKSWVKVREDPGTSATIPVQVKEEGRYGFALRARSGAGRGESAPSSGDEPDIWVGVDETAPRVQIQAVSVSGPPEAHRVTVKWAASDQHLTDLPITLFHAENLNPQVWRQLAGPLPNTGLYVWTLPKDYPFSSFLVRVEAVDQAGNKGSDQTRDLVCADLAVPKARIKGVVVLLGPGTEVVPEQDQAHSRFLELVDILKRYLEQLRGILLFLPAKK